MIERTIAGLANLYITSQEMPQHLKELREINQRDLQKCKNTMAELVGAGEKIAIEYIMHTNPILSIQDNEDWCGYKERLKNYIGAITLIPPQDKEPEDSYIKRLHEQAALLGTQMNILTNALHTQTYSPSHYFSGTFADARHASSPNNTITF